METIIASIIGGVFALLAVLLGNKGNQNSTKNTLVVDQSDNRKVKVGDVILGNDNILVRAPENTNQEENAKEELTERKGKARKKDDINRYTRSLGIGLIVVVIVFLLYSVSIQITNFPVKLIFTSACVAIIILSVYEIVFVSQVMKSRTTQIFSVGINLLTIASCIYFLVTQTQISNTPHFSLIWVLSGLWLALQTTSVFYRDVLYRGQLLCWKVLAILIMMIVVFLPELGHIMRGVIGKQWDELLGNIKSDITA